MRKSPWVLRLACEELRRKNGEKRRVRGDAQQEVRPQGRCEQVRTGANEVVGRPGHSCLLCQRGKLESLDENSQDKLRASRRQTRKTLSAAVCIKGLRITLGLRFCMRGRLLVSSPYCIVRAGLHPQETSLCHSNAAQMPLIIRTLPKNRQHEIACWRQNSTVHRKAHHWLEPGLYRLRNAPLMLKRLLIAPRFI